MFPTSTWNIKLFKRIYIYITPVIIIYDEIQNSKKEKDDDDDKEVMKEVLKLIGSMRHTACHNILKGYFIQQLFVNMVKLYKYFELDLLKDKFVKDLWIAIAETDRQFKICKYDELKSEEKFIDYELPDVKSKCQKFFDKFKELLEFLYNKGEQCQILRRFPIGSFPKINAIYLQVAPIILWYEYFDKNFRKENENDLFFKINFDTKVCVDHFLEKVVNEDILKQVMENICIIYLPFGIDLYESRKNVESLLKAKPNRYKLVKKNLNFNDLTKEKYADEIINEVRKVLCNKNHPLNEKYFLFGQMLHYFVSTKIERGNMITQVFQRNNNNIEWCDIENRFITKDMNNNRNKKSIFKLASPFFVWIEVVNNYQPIEFVRNQSFYLSIKKIRQKIINYLIKKNDNIDKENYILDRINFFYEPIEKYYNNIDRDLCYHNQRTYQFYRLFQKLVYWSVIGRKQHKCSYSFIARYYYGKRVFSTDMENQGKMFDIFNFCGVFYIFIKYFENYSNNQFYRKMKAITVQITQYIIEGEKGNTYKNNEGLQELQDQIIEGMKSVFFGYHGSSDFVSFQEMFAQLFSYIVKSRCHIEISGINFDRRFGEITNTTSNLYT